MRLSTDLDEIFPKATVFIVCARLVLEAVGSDIRSRGCYRAGCTVLMVPLGREM